jgi:hypothetical protein
MLTVLIFNRWSRWHRNHCLNCGQQHAYILHLRCGSIITSRTLAIVIKRTRAGALIIPLKASDIFFRTGTRLSGEESTRLILASPTYSPQSDREFQDRQEQIFRPMKAIVKRKKPEFLVKCTHKVALISSRG